MESKEWVIIQTSLKGKWVYVHGFEEKRDMSLLFMGHSLKIMIQLDSLPPKVHTLEGWLAVWQC